MATREIEIKDSTGAIISPLSIVGMANSGPWSEFQGLVVDPNSGIETDGYCVATYFFSEAQVHHFVHRSRSGINIQEWDTQYAKENRRGRGDFLLKDDLWHNSPRIVCFKPDELVVQKHWNVKTLAERLFHSQYHSIHSLTAHRPSDPSAYMCFIEQCRKPATEIALFNMWGSLFPLFVCEDCMPSVHGVRADALPKIKDDLLSPEGQPAALLIR